MQSSAWKDSRLRLNPSIYRPKEYVLPVTVENAPNRVGNNSLTLSNLPFLLEFVTHGVVGIDEADQNAKYSVIFSDQTYQFNRDWTLAPLMFGHSYQKMRVVPMTIPTFFRGSDALRMQVLNHRVFPPFMPADDYVVIEFTFHGFEKYKDLGYKGETTQ